MPEARDLVLNPAKTLTYRVCAAIVRGLSWVFFHPTVTGCREHPLEGPVIIAPIHRSNVDFAFSLFISPRKAFFMAKEGRLSIRAASAALLTQVLARFPSTATCADRESMRLSEEVLRRGQALVIFPEGTRKEGTCGRAAARRGDVSRGANRGEDRARRYRGQRQAMPVGCQVSAVRQDPRRRGSHRSTPPVGEGRVSRSEISAKSEELRKSSKRCTAEARSDSRALALAPPRAKDHAGVAKAKEPVLALLRRARRAWVPDRRDFARAPAALEST